MKSDGRISVAEVVACVEQMDFIVDGPLEGLIRSVVPAAVEVDRLSLNDAIKVRATTSRCTADAFASGETWLLHGEMPHTCLWVLNACV